MKISVKLLFPVIFVMLCLFTTASAFAQVPTTMTYNGFLMSNNAPANNPADVSFKIFDAENGGTSLWQQNPSSVDIKTGRFSARLSNLNAGLFNGQTLWLEVTINNETLSPRTEVGSMPYAFRAGDAQTIQGKTPDQLGGGGGGEPDTLASLNCNNDQIAFFTAGSWACTNMPSYTGTNFATSGQNCPAGQIVSGIAADGKVTCIADKNDNTTYSGTNFATSGQACPAGQIVSGISAAGAVTCVADKDTNTTYSGANFATSGQNCPAGQIVSGISAAGAVTCVADKNDNTTYTAGTGLSLSGTTFSVQNGGITNTHLAGSITPSKVTGTAATLTGNQSFNGNISANQFNYRTNKTMVYKINRSDFKPTSETSQVIGERWTFATQGGAYLRGTAASVNNLQIVLQAPIRLPVGTRMTAINCLMNNRTTISGRNVQMQAVIDAGGFYGTGYGNNTANQTPMVIFPPSANVVKSAMKAINLTTAAEMDYALTVTIRYPTNTFEEARFLGCTLDLSVPGPDGL